MLVKKWWRLIFLVLVLVLTGCNEQDGQAELSLSSTELEWVGEQVFQNECAGKVTCLVHWNVGEAFPSLGIGHFIWYPKSVDGPFVESFPALMAFMRSKSVELPKWLEELDPMVAPWPDRETFLTQKGSERVDSLQEFLWQTRGLQAEFIFARAKASMLTVIEAAAEEQKGAIAKRLSELNETPGGTYALIDYVNFKGEGLASSETYKGQGWGLLQVLQEMGDMPSGEALAQFRGAAGRVLTRRAENAQNPIERERWLKGWLKRLETYREPV
ncbi:MAG: hypothetical protein WD623_13100 [Marinobacter sp.]|uniref:hypothetical protein n=1 Tax=Marinobacter sp. TaxID=50741 RepID=UPI0034A08D1C